QTEHGSAGKLNYVDRITRKPRPLVGLWHFTASDHDSLRIPGPNADSHPDANACTKPHPHTNPNTHAHSDSHSYPNSDAHPHAHPHPNTHSDSHTDPYANPPGLHRPGRVQRHL